MSNFDIQSSQQNGVIVVRISGAADLAGADRIERELGTICQRASGSLVIDLEGVTFIGSLALSVLLVFQQKIERKGHLVAWARPSPSFLAMMRVAKIERVFRCFDTVDDAVRACVA